MSKKVFVFLTGLLMMMGLLVFAHSASATAPYSCTTSTTNGSCGPYVNPAVTLGTDQTDNVVQDEWNAGSTEGHFTSQVLSSNSSSDWQAVANMTGNGAVLTSPEDQVTPQNWTGANNLPVPVADYSSIKSTYNVTLPANPGASDDYEADYDIWLGDSTKTQWTNDQEIMVWTDTVRQTPAGTDTGKTWTDPTTGAVYEIWVDTGSSTTLGPDGIVSFKAKTNSPSGSLSLYDLFTFLKTNGYSTGSMGVDQVTFGFELCNTSGQNETFTVNNYTLSATGDGKNGAPGGGTPTQPAPVVTTSPATNVTSTGATLNGSVNPEGASTSEKFDYGTSTAYGNSTAVTDAGTGTSAVNESDSLTGLLPSTTYHYRIEATNSAGTSDGADQTFTTAATGGGGGTVAFDSATGAKKANSGSLTWSQTIGSGSNRAVLVEATVGAGNDNNCSQTVKLGSATLTKLAVIHPNGQHSGYMDIWGMANPPSGANTFTFTASGCASGTPNELTAGSESFTGASQAAPFSAVTSAVGAGTAPVVTAASSTGDMMAGFVAAGNSVTSAKSPATARFTENQDSSTGAGNSAGATSASTGSNVAMGWTLGASDWWGAGAVQVQHA